jgi:hypothetical protein
MLPYAVANNTSLDLAVIVYLDTESGKHNKRDGKTEPPASQQVTKDTETSAAEKCADSYPSITVTALLKDVQASL